VDLRLTPSEGTGLERLREAVGAKTCVALLRRLADMDEASRTLLASVLKDPTLAQRLQQALHTAPSGSTTNNP